MLGRRRPVEAFVRGLGELEADVMERLWAADGDRSVRDVLEEINANSRRPLAYTTVMTVLDNLHRKGWLTRQLVDRAYRYRPVKSKQEHSAVLMADALASSGDLAATLLAFLAQLDSSEAKHLADLVEQASPRSRPRRGRS
jgi:predicted transcriptional regulator